MKFLNKSNSLSLLSGGVVATIFMIAQPGLSSTVKFIATKPTAGVAPLSDEQQGILAVRGVKPSVVDIIGDMPTISFSGQPVASDSVAGTGFIISSDGLIVSNSHVVSDTTLTYTVTLLDGKQFPAKVLGLDKYDDVAILKIEATGLATARFGNSDSLETGQTVFAIGNSLGIYQNSVTKGVVSGLGRDITVGDENAPQPRLQNLIQTDAAISPGNSGGPLVDLAGEVVGMSTLIDTSGQGLGFAVPSNVMQNAVDQLQKFGKVSKPYLGVTFATVLSPATVQGAYVKNVALGGPADRAGIKANDIITEINHEKITRQNELDTVVSKYAPGAQLLVTYSRNEQSFDTTIVLGEFK